MFEAATLTEFTDNTPMTDIVLHRPDDLIAIFNQLFVESENTQLIRGGDEPIYLPADSECSFHRLIFAHGFFSSALHEISHWCIAGAERRKVLDYGYWYAPDGRTEQQQLAFERVEVKPQALEWILSKACGKKFRVSVDNLTGAETNTQAFKQAVYQQVLDYAEQGLPKRAQLFFNRLCAFYTVNLVSESHCFSPHPFALSELA
ncbi:MAG: elongation factor P hydroxylase [Spongiibacteraceae bacterium]